MATRPIRVWSGSDWEDVAIAPYDSGEFLSAATASATYLPISASATLGVGKDDAENIIAVQVFG